MRLLRYPATWAALGIILTVLVVAVVVMILHRTGGAKAVSDNAGIIGALVALGGVFTAQMVSISLADKRKLETREDDIAKETRLAIAEVSRNMAAAVQAMLWFTSKAASAHANLTQDDILAYDKDIKELLPNIVGSLMVVSMLDKNVSDQLSPLMQEIYSVDARIAAASWQFSKRPELSAKRIEDVYREAIGPLYDKLAESIGGMAGSERVGDDLKKGMAPGQLK
jgi:hypothetical protein